MLPLLRCEQVAEEVPGTMIRRTHLPSRPQHPSPLPYRRPLVGIRDDHTADEAIKFADLERERFGAAFHGGQPFGT